MTLDTTLRLAPPYYFSRKSPPADNPPPLRWFLPGFFDGVENDDVDTTLRLCPPGTVVHHGKPKTSDIPPPVVYDPMPLRWFCGGVDGSTIKNSSKKGRGAEGGDDRKKKRKLDDADTSGGGDDNKKNKRRSIYRNDGEASTSAAGEKKRRRRDVEDEGALVPVGGVLRAVESRGGSRPEFLYRKKLEKSDVSKNLHRVLLSGGERMVEFLSVEEAKAVLAGKKGLTMVGVDGGGKVYEKLVLNRWPSLKMLVINSDWTHVVAANNVMKDDVMEIWGYRENGKSCLAFNFRRERQERDGDGDGGDNANHAASTSSSSNGVIKKTS